MNIIAFLTIVVALVSIISYLKKSSEDSLIFLVIILPLSFLLYFATNQINGIDNQQNKVEKIDYTEEKGEKKSAARPEKTNTSEESKNKTAIKEEVKLLNSLLSELAKEIDQPQLMDEILRHFDYNAAVIKEEGKLKIQAHGHNIKDYLQMLNTSEHIQRIEIIGNQLDKNSLGEIIKLNIKEYIN